MKSKDQLDKEQISPNNLIIQLSELISKQNKSFQSLEGYLINHQDKIQDFINLILLNKKQKGSRIIISGMGKSGHIAGKFASSLSSTGTAAIYIHPSEASHGDLGMISKNDLIIALSVSGETAELADIIFFAKENLIPLISISYNAKSTLGLASQLSFELPLVEEICPMGLAPTTSSWIMMAFCDILTVLVLNNTNFVSKDFKKLHPAGNLAKIVTEVSDAMRIDACIPLITIDKQLKEIISEIDVKKLGCVGVVNKDKLIGIITDGDIRRFLLKSKKDIFLSSARDIMSANPKVIKATNNLLEAKQIMTENKISQLFVVSDKSKPIGIIHLHDC